MKFTGTVNSIPDYFVFTNNLNEDKFQIAKNQFEINVITSLSLLKPNNQIEFEYSKNSICGNYIYTITSEIKFP